MTGSLLRSVMKTVTSSVGGQVTRLIVTWRISGCGAVIQVSPTLFRYGKVKV